MALSWNEIKSRAITFSREWADTIKEEADAKPFLVAFFDVFGISRKRVATFEYRVKKLDDSDGYIDLLWKSMILVEMKSKGKNLDKAFDQAVNYTYGLKQPELPKFILVSDFENFRLKDIENNIEVEFKLSELVNNVKHFAYLIGYQKQIYKEQDPANIQAAELMGKLHDRLREIGYEGHPLEIYLVRLLFCLFAEDTTIFNRLQFQEYIEQKTNIDGSDLAPRLQALFQVLNTPLDKRYKNLDEHLGEFPFVNGKLFDEILPTASFDRKMRDTLLECCYLDWSKISPEIFGSMFQSVMNPIERRNLGAHYTSEINILKVIKPLFLDDLWNEFEKIKDTPSKLQEFHYKLSQMKFLDPACGCGNFLIVTYRELRLLELELLNALYKNQLVTNIDSLILLNIDQFYGIEYEEFPARIAEVAMWLVDHQMNMLVSHNFGHYFVRLPLHKSANIFHGDALEINWQSLINPTNPYTAYTDNANIVRNIKATNEDVNVYSKSFSGKMSDKTVLRQGQTSNIKFDYIFGNPPFVGSRLMTKSQKESIRKIFDDMSNVGDLDYVSAWYIKAAKYIQNTKIKVAFVSTNSIVQGLQTSLLWDRMLNKYNITIHFAHRTFKWSNEAGGNAAVYCVIVGFANFDTDDKRIFYYEDIKGEAHEVEANNINPYLVDADNIIIKRRYKAICDVPKMVFGSMPNDGGNFLFTEEEKNDFIQKEPISSQYFRPLLSAYEYINGEKRWCLWLKDADPSDIRKSKFILERIKNVQKLRTSSKRTSTQELANYPALFGENRQPNSDFILIPSTTSENRKYIPMGIFDKNYVANNSCHLIPKGKIYHLGILMSKMHIAWVRYVAGRLKSDYRYSATIVYNNFPWPENPNKKQIKTIESAAKKVLKVRDKFSNSSLADLYNPLSMPAELQKAHSDLDRAVDSAYRSQSFTNDVNRMEFLLDLYQKYLSELFTNNNSKKRRRKRKVK